MELYNLPVMQRWMKEPADIFAKRFLKLNKLNTHAAANLMMSFAKSINSLAGKIGATTEEDQRQKLSEMRQQIFNLASVCAVKCSRDSVNRFAVIVHQVKIEKALGSMRNMIKLRRVTSLLEEAYDNNACEDWLRSQVDIVRCDDCGDFEYSTKIINTYHEEYVCRNCAENNHRFSEYYQQYVHNDRYREARNADGSYVLIDEDDDDFEYNEDSDCWFHVDYVPPDPPTIGSYHSSKPYQSIIIDEWSKIKHRWFGVELEVEVKDHSIDKESKAKALHKIINNGERGKRVFFENDGSLSNGFEIVTQPMSLPAHHDMWQFLRDRDAVRYLLSHNTRTCGLHVHVNKDNLTQIQIAKIVTFVNDPINESMIRAIARRYAEGYCKIKQKDLASAHQSSDRYEAINVTPRHTIEFRIFKGSLKYESVIAAIEFCNALTDFCSLPSTNDAASLNGDNFIDYINDQGAAETTVLRPYMNAVLQTA
jgi:ribosomal protein L37AE/L43A